MKILDLFKATPAPSVRGVRGGRLLPGTLRKGMWVRLDGRTGILNNLKDLEAEVHLVNDEGETIAITSVLVSTLKQALFEEIPVGRRPSRDRATELGY